MKIMLGYVVPHVAIFCKVYPNIQMLNKGSKATKDANYKVMNMLWLKHKGRNCKGPSSRNYD